MPSLNITELGSNIVSVPQLYGTTHTLFAHVLPSQGIDSPVRRSPISPPTSRS